MGGVVVLGGYGRVGSLCVREIIETSNAGVVAAGRNIQRAEQLALAYGERVESAYVNSSDLRTLRSVLPGAAAVLCCSGSDSLAALEVALEARVPFISLSPLHLDERTFHTLHERAWQVQIPVVLDAGAVPGLPGVLCEWLVRRFPEIHALRVASTGPWRGTDLAQRDVGRARGRAPPAIEYRDREWVRPRIRSLRWEFPDPVGACGVRPAHSPELADFGEAHCVQSLIYLEAAPSAITRGFERLIGLDPPWEFGVAAEVWGEEELKVPALQIALASSDVVAAAAAVAVTLARAVSAGKIPAGVSTPREAVNPSLLLDGLEKRGISVRTTPPTPH